MVTDRAGNIVEGDLRPSTDLATHLELYNAFPGVGGVVHTHSRYATALAQAERDLPCYGTTHADYFFGSVPCTRHLTSEEIHESYERSTGLVIAETFRDRGLDPAAVPAVLVRKHGPFTWGPTPEKAVENALVLDECARIALLTELAKKAAAVMADALSSPPPSVKVPLIALPSPRTVTFPASAAVSALPFTVMTSPETSVPLTVSCSPKPAKLLPAAAPMTSIP